MAAEKTFLVVDDNPDSRFLLVKTLLRKFPNGIFHECEESAEAIAIAATKTLSAIVAHRSADMDGVNLIKELRAANPHAIIVMVSGLDRTDAAVRAGASCFLNYDEWLRVGSLVTDLLERSQSAQRRAAREKNERESHQRQEQQLERSDLSTDAETSER
jgi:DNA-binding NtrC family response regulator